MLVYMEYHSKVERLKKQELRNAKRKNRRKEGTRAHRKTLHSEYGRAMLMNIRHFVRDHLVLAEGKFLLASCMYERFAEVHGHKVDQNLLRRHGKNVLLAEMPGAAYGRFRFERGFHNVALKCCCHLLL